MVSSYKVCEIQFFMHFIILVDNSVITIIVSLYGFEFGAGFHI